MSVVAMKYNAQYGEGREYDRSRNDMSETYVFWN